VVRKQLNLQEHIPEWQFENTVVTFTQKEVKSFEDIFPEVKSSD